MKITFLVCLLISLSSFSQTEPLLFDDGVINEIEIVKNDKEALFQVLDSDTSVLAKDGQAMLGVAEFFVAYASLRYKKSYLRLSKDTRIDRKLLKYAGLYFLFAGGSRLILINNECDPGVSSTLTIAKAALNRIIQLHDDYVTEPLSDKLEVSIGGGFLSGGALAHGRQFMILKSMGGRDIDKATLKKMRRNKFFGTLGVGYGLYMMFNQAWKDESETHTEHSRLYDLDQSDPDSCINKNKHSPGRLEFIEVIETDDVEFYDE